MRTLAVILMAAGIGLAVSERPPQQIVYARVSPNPNGLGLFIASADGSDERPLLGAADLDYDPAFAPDGRTIVFTSEREGSADLFRVETDGTGLERLTDDPAYDDQAAFSPDGRRLVFVSTRQGGYARVWMMDLLSKRVTALTSGSGGDYRPSWSPDGAWIAFASGRGSELPFAYGRWERLQLADLYVVHPDGSGLERVGTHGEFCGSPKWNRDSRHLIAYCMSAEQTLSNRRAVPEAAAGREGTDTRLLSFDIATGASDMVTSGSGVLFNPSFVGSTVGYIRKFAQGSGAGIYYADGRSGPKGDIRTASWSPDGSRVVFHKRLTTPAPVWRPSFSRLPGYQLTMTGILPSFAPAGDEFAMTGRPPNPARPFGSSIVVAATGTNQGRVIYQDDSRNVLAPQWSPRGDRIIFGVGVFGAFFDGFNSRILEPGDRAEGGAHIAIVNRDGSGFRELTGGADNSAFPSMAPDGLRFVYRAFGPTGDDGLKIRNMESGAVTTLTHGYDNFPLWSPRGDLVMFSRLTKGNYEIWTIKPNGTGARKVTSGRGTDAHQGWSPDGERIVFASSRMGFKDEAIYTDAPQPYGEIFVMRSDGTNVEQLTDDQWEEGTPAWRPGAGSLHTTARR
jgi:TolB protein